jgi:thiol-disulfide isomerase/thioredoxin
MKLTLAKTVIAPAIIMLSLACVTPANAAAALMPGDKAPDNLGISRDGNPIKVSDFKGAVVVASFWASWCGPCKKELPVLEALQQRLAPELLRVVTVNIEERDEFRNATKRMGAWKSVLSHDYRNEASAAYSRKGVPHLVIINSDGTIKRTFIGYSEESVDKVMREVAEAILSAVYPKPVVANGDDASTAKAPVAIAIAEKPNQ